MRVFIGCIFLASVLAAAQGTPPIDSAQQAQAQPQAIQAEEHGSPPEVPNSSKLHQMTLMIKRQINKAINGKSCPNLENWRPLSTREKLDMFLNRTHSPRTFAAAGIDTLKDSSLKERNPEYERSLMGFGQEYGVRLGVTETEVFFEQFLVPSVLKQDPRYFRNPSLPFFRRSFYSVSRVLITRSDRGHNTFNASRIIGGAASQSLADLYVPGQRQGLSPILNRVTFDLVRDAGLNLVHEFWPDLRHRFLHR